MIFLPKELNNRMRLSKFYIPVFLSISVFANATELAPWYHRDIEIFPEIKYRFQTFNEVDTAHGTENFNEDDHFVTLGASLNYDIYSAELEVTTADTRKQTPDVDNGQLTLRYRWLNDVLGGDPVSLTTGLTLRGVSHSARRDIASFHHGGFETETHVAIGKEYDCADFWVSRIWGLLAVGIADVGSPWYRADLHFEKNCWDFHQVHFFANTLWGGGNSGLKLHKHFAGYGPIKHESVDIGLGYRYFLENYAIIELEVAARVYAQNFPKYAKNLVIKLFFPFWL